MSSYVFLRGTNCTLLAQVMYTKQSSVFERYSLEYFIALTSNSMIFVADLKYMIVIRFYTYHVFAINNSTTLQNSLGFVFKFLEDIKPF